MNYRLSKTYLLLISCIIVAGFFLRIYNISEQSYWIDEGFTIMQTRAVAAHGYPLLNSGKIELKDPLLPYLLVPIQSFFQESPLTFRIVSAIFGTLSIAVAFLLGTALFSRNTGLLFSFFMAFSYWHIAWSRQVRGYALLVFFTLLTTLFVVMHEKTKRDRHLFLGFISTFLAFLSKNSGILTFLSLITYTIARKKHFTAGLLVLAFFSTSFFFRHIFIISSYKEALDYFHYYAVDYFWKNFGIIPILAVAGFWLAWTREKQTRASHLFIVQTFLTFLLFFSFFVYVVQARYLLVITPFLFLYTAYFLTQLSSNFQRRKTVFVLTLVGLLIADAATSKALSFTPHSDYSLESYTPQPNFKEAYQNIQKNLSANDSVVSAYPFMDIIYLGRSDFAIPISYTGRVEDSTVNNSKEYYSGTRKLFGEGRKTPLDTLEKAREYGNVYIILDSMSLSKIPPTLFAYIDEEKDFTYQTGTQDGQQIFIYKFETTKNKQ